MFYILATQYDDNLIFLEKKVYCINIKLHKISWNII